MGTMHSTGKHDATWQQMQKEFLDACDVQCFKLQEFLQQRHLAHKHGMVQALNLAYNLIYEEVNAELLRPLQKILDHARSWVQPTQAVAVMTVDEATELYDAICDSIYVICQLANVMGLDIEIGYQEVHDSNMTKVGSDGKVIRRADGKILKPAGWRPPRMKELIEIQAECGKLDSLQVELSDIMVRVQQIAKLDGQYVPAFKNKDVGAIKGLGTLLKDLGERTLTAAQEIQDASRTQT